MLSNGEIERRNKRGFFKIKFFYRGLEKNLFYYINRRLLAKLKFEVIAKVALVKSFIGTPL
jgi:hypothetical protein